MITFLNDRDWQTRAAFFRDVACMASQAGFAGMEAFLLPCVEQVLYPGLHGTQRPADAFQVLSIYRTCLASPPLHLVLHVAIPGEILKGRLFDMQALSDESDTVVVEAIGFLTEVVEARHMRKRSLLTALSRVVAKLQHNNSTAVGSAAADFIAAAARCLTASAAHFVFSTCLDHCYTPSASSAPYVHYSCQGHHRALDIGDKSHPSRKGFKTTRECLHTCRSLSPAEMYALLTPLVMPVLKSEPVAMGDASAVAANLRTGSHPYHSTRLPSRPCSKAAYSS